MTYFYDLMWRLVMVDQVDVDMVARVVLLAWAMWYHRNEVRMGAQRKPGNALVSWATSYLEEYSAAIVAQTNLEPIIQRAMTWSPPPRFLFKINVDGVVDKANGKASVGVIVKDELGRVEATMCKNLDAPLGAIETKSKAIEAGLLFALDIGIRDIVVESDCFLMIQALKGTTTPPSVISTVTQGVLDLSMGFNTVEFSHVKRQGNRLAHMLAKHALSITDFITWIEETPCFLEQALIHDVTF